MVLDKIRTETRKRFERVNPALVRDVVSTKEFEYDYISSFRARNMRTLERHEFAKKILFCRNCISADKQSGRFICYRLCCSVEDHLVENSQNALVRMLCFNCDFDLYVPKPDPIPHVSATEVRMREARMREDMMAQSLPPQPPLSSAEIAYRQMVESELRKHKEMLMNQVAPAYIVGGKVGAAYGGMNPVPTKGK